MILSQKTSPAIAGLDRDRMIVVFGIGALEQHSNHMPCGTDHLLGDAVIERLEEAMPGQLLCLPTVWFGCSSHHLGFPGTVSVSTMTMSSVITDIIGSVQRSGFRRVLIINSHGGNRAVLGCAIQEMGTTHADMTVVGVSYWDAARDELMAERETAFGGMGHACEFETSLMLQYRPQWVDMSRAEPDGISPPSRFTRGELLTAPVVAMYQPVKSTSHHGGFGDPMSASAAKGERFFDLVNRNLVELCNDMLQERL